MTNRQNNTTLDAFLGGALNVLQPKAGYRAATDPVFLAASIPARAGQSVLELGCGVGVAMLCLGRRVPGLQITGLEKQPDYAELARQNAHANGIDANIITGNLTDMPGKLRDQAYDHVMFNPPFYDALKVSAPENPGKSQAHVTDLTIDDWIVAGLKRLKPKGRLTFIHRSEILPQALGALARIAGDITIKPLISRQDQAAKRVIVTCRKGTKGPAVLLSALIIHKEDAHSKDMGSYSTTAQAVLREAMALDL
jgi:tRNA1(Val) A37 N6-methylase TrmN6